mgnify:CR=1 FL=1
MPTVIPYIPQRITVHLGPPGRDAENVTVSFVDYVKNVASSEIYPTWPESAIRANIYAQITYALNRVYSLYPEQVNRVLFNHLDTHDTMRAVTRCGNLDIFRQQQAVLMTLPGSPCIYYGTEIAMEGFEIGIYNSISQMLNDSMAYTLERIEYRLKGE